MTAEYELIGDGGKIKIELLWNFYLYYKEKLAFFGQHKYFIRKSSPLLKQQVQYIQYNQHNQYRTFNTFISIPCTTQLKNHLVQCRRNSGRRSVRHTHLRDPAAPIRRPAVQNCRPNDQQTEQ